MRVLVKSVAASMLGVLSACSTGPSEGDIKKAVEKSMMGLGSEHMSIKKLGCETSGNGYNCDVEMTMEVPLVGKQTTVANLRFVKGSEGWATTGGGLSAGGRRR